jgi:sortase A
MLAVEYVGGYFFQQRAQGQLLSDFQNTTRIAASAYGQQGLSPMPDTAPAIGSAVAVIDIPALNLRQVALEGSQSGQTRNGIGHVLGTPLPGEAGHAVLVGRRSTFGAPLRNIMTVKAGDSIKVATVQGTATYKVLPAGTAADSLPANVLEVRTGSSQIVSAGTTSLFAELQGTPYRVLPMNNPASDRNGHGIELLLVLELLILAIAALPWTLRHFNRVVVWFIAGIPLASLVVAAALLVDSFLPSYI